MTLRQDVDSEGKDANNFSLERVADLTDVLSSKTEVAINQIDRINGETQVLAINALIEASRAGEVGKTFGVVAEEMSKLSKKIEDTTENMRKESLSTMGEMGKIINAQITNIRGIRL
ncbi:MAG: methyl-accepting chemotaxis protein, partial [Nitrososphaera sp.]|nr:methyl-accepting chemotaxis protein [Nitrososphaera sp.]